MNYLKKNQMNILQLKTPSKLRINQLDLKTDRAQQKNVNKPGDRPT